MIDFKKSLQIISEQHLLPQAYENVFLTEAEGRILAQDIVANENNPSFETAAMDGYAIKYEDMQKSLPVVGDNPAGSANEYELKCGEAVKTFTGSLMPKGSDTLVPVENVTVTNETVQVTQSVPRGFAVRNVGEIYEKGDLLIKKGTLLTYAHIGVIAALNIAYVKVYQKPKVAIASSGSEILDIAQTQSNPSQIRSTNHIILEVLAQKFGADVIQLGVVEDDKTSLTQIIENGLRKADILITTGGVSVGDYDFTKEVLTQKIGAEVLFHGVKIKPGQHILLARKDDKFILSLPGFAYSSTVTFLLYFFPLLEKFGYPSKLQRVNATLQEPLRKPLGKTTFIAANCVYSRGRYNVDFKGKKQGSSALLTNLMDEAALVIVHEQTQRLEKGDEVEVLLLN
jgi:molybdopterin molybdotransferase